MDKLLPYDCRASLVTPSSLCTLRAGQIEMRAETGEFEHETTRLTLAGVFRVNLILALLFSMICFGICSSGGCLSVCRPPRSLSSVNALHAFSLSRA